MKRSPRIPGRRVVWFGKPGKQRPVVLTDAEVRAWLREGEKRKKKGKQ